MQTAYAGVLVDLILQIESRGVLKKKINENLKEISCGMFFLLNF
jgi:hypothetical protein